MSDTHIIDQYWKNENSSQWDLNDKQKNRKKYLRVISPIRGSEWNKLFLCTQCNQVWSRWQIGQMKHLRYLNSDFPKRQEESDCPKCKDDGVKYDKVEYE